MLIRISCPQSVVRSAGIASQHMMDIQLVYLLLTNAQALPRLLQLRFHAIALQLSMPDKRVTQLSEALHLQHQHPRSVPQQQDSSLTCGHVHDHLLGRRQRLNGVCASGQSRPQSQAIARSCNVVDASNNVTRWRRSVGVCI